ncbi:MAG: siphovirus ReqiPepy6 Gp37-like family protein [Clostridiales bacterium]|nr:siphovirus ReqiPepy6 Gp37-like family protein [Clostridiales bacterium]MCI1951502.1 siphovirus ReqiPepy6 Gp37-like family protein [Clostridiales bacterium]MCI1960631.1 siphovirus ReqiPepy6 Gp37-like family protein [Clostridiales bacterium]MCI1960677.1 siphovirus ReqiPepy6 Gp37-like family protein [Clostridiales bacterium]MCI2021118.1 siphovirus ReqiPepy6 Gp37-like family protein [Clostridiales bacterium]
MLDLIILNADFAELGALDDFSSLIWDRKYYETGNFELHCSPKYFPLFMGAEYIWSKGLVETGIIQDVSYDKEKHDTIVKGHFLEDILYGRLITDIVKGTKTPEVWAREWITNYCITPADSKRKIAKLSLGTMHGLGTPVPVQTRGDDLPSKIREIATPQECGFRILYDYPHDQMYAEIWQGLDRTENQAVHSLAVFSDEEETSSLSTYTRSAGDYRNFAYVAGEGEDADRIIVTVDQTNGNPRKELWVDARDLQWEKDDTDTTYKAKLIQRGKEKLAQYPIAESADFSVLTSNTLIYREDYDLGDLGTVIDQETGIKYTARVEEIEEVWENGSHTVTPTLGKSPSTILGKVKREVNEVGKSAETPQLSPVARSGEYTDLKGIPTGYLTKADLLTYVFPVGTYYISFNNVSPASFLGGTWMRQEDVFLYGSTQNEMKNGTYYGGSKTKTILQDNLPNVGLYTHGYYTVDNNHDGSTVQVRARDYLVNDPTDWIGALGGGGKAMDIMPPYVGVHMWKRLS